MRSSHEEIQMAVRFYKTLENLKGAVNHTGISGTWRQIPPNMYQFRGDNGAIMNWWSGDNTIQFQGDVSACRELEARLQDALGMHLVYSR